MMLAKRFFSFLLLLMFSASFLLSGCVRTVTDSAVDKVHEVKKPVPQFPAYAKPSVSESLLKRIHKVRSGLKTVASSLSEIRDRSQAFPTVTFQTLDTTTSLQQLAELLSSTTGWRILFPAEIADAQLQLKPMYQESLAELITSICHSLGTEATANFEHRVIQLLTLQTKTFVFPILPSQETVSFDGSDTIDASEDDSQEMTTAFSQDIMADIETELGSILGADPRSQLSRNNATGSFTVTAPIQLMHTVESRVNELREMLSKQIVVNLTTLKVVWNSDKDREFFYRLAHTDFDESFTISTGVSNLLAGNSLHFEFEDMSFDEVMNLVFNYTTSHGQSEIVSKSTVFVQNGFPASLISGRKYSYVERVVVSQTEYGQTTNPTLGVIQEGLVLNLFAKIYDNDKILLNLAPSFNTIESVREFPGGYEAPIVNQEKYLSRFLIPNGAVVLVSGLQSTDSTVSSTKTVADLPLSDADTAKRADYLMLVSAKIVNADGMYQIDDK